MLTLEQVQAEAKKRNVRLFVDGGFYLETLPDDITSKEQKKKYETWKTNYLKRWETSEDRTEAYAKEHKVWYPNGYKRHSPPNEKTLQRRYKEHNFNRESLGFIEGQSFWSCAISEFGSFGQNKLLDKHWDLLLAYYVNKSRYHFLKCAVPRRKSYKPILDGLKKAGFEMRAAEKSNHGKYKVEVWEYIKPWKKGKTKK